MHLLRLHLIHHQIQPNFLHTIQASQLDVENEALLATIGDFIRSGKLFGKIVHFDTYKGKKLAGIDPSSGMPSGYKGSDPGSSRQAVFSRDRASSIT